MSRFSEATIPEGVVPKYYHHRDVTGRIIMTNCSLFFGDQLVGTASACVSPREKSPSKKIGRNVSLGRALKKLSEEYQQYTKGGMYVKR